MPSVVSTFSGESRRKGDGRLSQRQGILKLKFSYVGRFQRRAIDKTSNRAICSVRRLHLRACDERVCWIPGLYQRTRESGRLINLRCARDAQYYFTSNFWKLSL